MVVLLDEDVDDIVRIRVRRPGDPGPQMNGQVSPNSPERRVPPDHAAIQRSEEYAFWRCFVDRCHMRLPAQDHPGLHVAEANGAHFRELRVKTLEDGQERM